MPHQTGLTLKTFIRWDKDTTVFGKSQRQRALISKTHHSPHR